MQLKVPLIRQPDDFTCGPTALQMVLKYFGKNAPLPTLCTLAKTTKKSGTTRKQMVETLKSFGLKTFTKHSASIKDIHTLLSKGCPIIVNYQDSTMTEGHYGVIIGFTMGKFILNDPYEPKSLLLDEKIFLKRWYGYHKTQFSRWMLAVAKTSFLR